MLTRLALAAAVLAVVATPARAAHVDLSFHGSSDTTQVIPLGGDQYRYQGVDEYYKSIAPSDGTLWTGMVGDPGQIYHYDLATNTLTETLPGPPSGGPSHWARGVGGMLWFTVGAWDNIHREVIPTNKFGRLDTVTDTVTEYSGLSADAIGGAIVGGPDGNVWILEAGTNSIARVTPTGAVTEFPLPAGLTVAPGRGEALTFGPGGDLYFLLTDGVGRMTTGGTYVGKITGGLADFRPDSIAYAADGNLWTTECGHDLITRISPSGAVYRMPDGSFPAHSCPLGMVAGPDGVPWFYEWNTMRIGHVVFDTPIARTDDPTAVSFDAADLNGRAASRGVATRVHFEYGTTTAYGRSTPERSIGDGDDGVDVTARPTDLRPLTTYHYRLVATSGIGTVRGADQTVTTGPLPPPPPPPLPVDRDGDGFAERVDCDDLSAAIHPGARDTPGDRIDQDCNGTDAAYPRFQPHAVGGWKKVRRGRFVFTRLVVDEMPPGSSLRLTCTGPGCPARDAYTATITKTVRRLDVVKRLKGAKLGKGATVELTLSRPGYVATVVRWVIAPPPRVTILCQAPGAKRAGAC